MAVTMRSDPRNQGDEYSQREPVPEFASQKRQLPGRPIRRPQRHQLAKAKKEQRERKQGPAEHMEITTSERAAKRHGTHKKINPNIRALSRISLLRLVRIFAAMLVS